MFGLLPFTHSPPSEYCRWMWNRYSQFERHHSTVANSAPGLNLRCARGASLLHLRRTNKRIPANSKLKRDWMESKCIQVPPKNLSRFKSSLVMRYDCHIASIARFGRHRFRPEMVAHWICKTQLFISWSHIPSARKAGTTVCQICTCSYLKYPKMMLWARLHLNFTRLGQPMLAKLTVANPTSRLPIASLVRLHQDTPVMAASWDIAERSATHPGTASPAVLRKIRGS